jgi:hypothetical protein
VRGERHEETESSGIPDSIDGTGLDATLGVYVNGRFATSLAVTSRYSWYYGQFRGPTPRRTAADASSMTTHG